MRILCNYILGGCRSGQTGQTQDLLAYAYEGSNPSPPMVSRRIQSQKNGQVNACFRLKGPNPSPPMLS